MFLPNTPGLSAATFKVAGGNQGSMQTVALMREMVTHYKKDLIVRTLALSLVESLPQKDYQGEIDTIFYYVRDQIRYVQDVYDVETLATPDKTIELGQGDCDDKAVLLASLLESIGFRTMFRVTGYNGPNLEHVYVYVEGPGVSLHLDPTEPEPPGYQPPNPTVSVYVD